MKIKDIAECFVGVIGYIMMIPVFIITSPVMPIVYAAGIEQEQLIKREYVEEIQLLKEELYHLKNSQ